MSRLLQVEICAAVFWGGLSCGVFPPCIGNNGGGEEVHQCLLSSFAGAQYDESGADSHPEGLFPPCHTSF